MIKISHLNPISTIGYSFPVLCSLGIIQTKSVKWFHCRDQFQGAINRQRRRFSFLFNYGSKPSCNYGAFETKFVRSIIYSDIAPLQKFMSKIEDKLKLKEKDRCVISPTDVEGIAHINMGPFWYSQPMKRSLFTAFLRCGVNYYEKTFAKALWSRTYTSRTRLAVNRFLEGYTNYTGDEGRGRRGWQYAFIHLNKKEHNKIIKRLLVKEEKNVYS